jgi:uncharacterized protein YggT (Ycf19 family)
MGMEFVIMVLYGLFYAILISIPIYLVLVVIRGAKTSKESADTSKEIKRLLEELVKTQKETNELLMKQKQGQTI